MSASFDLGPVELRVLGCLIEKQRTTPDVYPLSLNALRLACNQATNRDPVLDLDEHTIRTALDHLGRRGLTRLASGPGSRTAKFRHLLDDVLHLTGEEISLLCVLMLRGPQTPGELKARTERLRRFDDLDRLEHVLGELIDRELVRRLERRPGQKEQRYEQLLGDEQEAAPPVAVAAPAPDPVPEAQPRHGIEAFEELASGLDDDRLSALEQELIALRDEVAALRAELTSLRRTS